MDVKCERCNTEYEFDDALVSGRGTTVKCTNCGHKFKIRRSDGDFSEDFWNVTTGDGRTLVFTSLRELQRAIQGYLVERNDRLSRGGLPPKAIGQIPELAPFFEQREAAKKSAQPQKTVKTQDGLGPGAAAAAKEAAAAIAAAGPARPRQGTKPEFPAPPADDFAGKSTLIGTGPSSEQEAFPKHVPVAAPAHSPAPPPVPARTRTAPPPPTDRDPPRFDGVSTAPSAQPQQRTQSPQPPPVPAPRPHQQTVPMKRPPTPPPVPPGGQRASAPAQQVAPPTPAPMISRVPTPAMTHTPQVSHAPPLPDRARKSAPHQQVADAYTSDSHIPSGNRTVPSGSGSSMTGGRQAAVDPISSPLPPPAHQPRMRSLLAEIEEDRDRRGPSPSVPDFPEAPPRRRSVGGFIVASVVVGCLLMLGAVWAQKNLGITLGTKPPPPPPTTTVDPRVATFLTTGEKALADGNLEVAKESLDKASALAEKDPHVLLDLARLAATRADVLWLKSRLLAPDAADDHRITREGLTEQAASARKAADDALAVAPDDANAHRAKMDALRISGDRDGARALVPKISTISTQPESAYVLAALDLADAEPPWATIIERLKTASSAETGPGRARAALVFALGRSGDGPAAKAEVERLSAMARPHPLLSLLRGFADHAKGSKLLDGGAIALHDAAVAIEVVDAGKAGVVHTGGGGGGGGGGEALPTDVRQLVSQGEKARAKGDYDRARTLFSAAIDKNPNDSEALAGLAAIAYAQRDLNGARASYKRVLAINPNYMPALVGLADVEWDSGNQAGAVKMYKDIVDRYPEGAYPGRVKARAEGGG